MTYRQAIISDIPDIQRVRHSVTENRLSNPALVTDADVEDYITRRGKGWVYEENGQIAGFAIADLQEHSVWALFVDPLFEKKGIGTLLQLIMLDWYFSNSTETIWLSTSPGTRAEAFYRKSGWKETGTHGKGEIKFEMSLQDWKQQFQDNLPQQEISLMALVVKDYDEAIAFYTGKLGFILLEDTVLSTVKRWVRVKPPGPGNTALLLAKAANDEQSSRIGNQTGGRVFLFMHTDHFTRDYNLYKNRGVEFVREPVTEEYGTVAVFRDLYGNLWDLIQPSHY